MKISWNNTPTLCLFENFEVEEQFDIKIFSFVLA